MNVYEITEFFETFGHKGNIDKEGCIVYWKKGCTGSEFFKGELLGFDREILSEYTWGDLEELIDVLKSDAVVCMVCGHSMGYDEEHCKVCSDGYQEEESLHEAGLEWLVEKGWYHLFANNCLEQGTLGLNDSLSGCLIVDAFSWKDSKEGFEFWINVEGEYQEWYNKKVLEGLNSK